MDLKSVVSYFMFNGQRNGNDKYWLRDCGDYDHLELASLSQPPENSTNNYHTRMLQQFRDECKQRLRVEHEIDARARVQR
jgi:hypothetical protein